LLKFTDFRLWNVSEVTFAPYRFIGGQIGHPLIALPKSELYPSRNSESENPLTHRAAGSPFHRFADLDFPPKNLSSF
jgi:hypothetical protein